MKKTYAKPQRGFLATGPRYPGVLSDDGQMGLCTHPRPASLPPVVDAAAIRHAIEQANGKYVDAMTRGDSAVLVASYTDDAVLMSSGEPAHRGHGEIGAAIAKQIQSAKVSNAKVNTANVDVAGDYAIETGSYEVTVTPKGGKPTPDKGKYVTVWKKQADGSWKVYRDITNSDGPPPKS